MKIETDTIFTQIQDNPLPYHSLKFQENSYTLIIWVFMSFNVCMNSILELSNCDRTLEYWCKQIYKQVTELTSHSQPFHQ